MTKAVRIHNYGGPEALRYEDVADEAPGDEVEPRRGGEGGDRREQHQADEHHGQRPEGDGTAHGARGVAQFGHWRLGRINHLKASALKAALVPVESSQSVWPMAPIWNGRGN